MTIMKYEIELTDSEAAVIAATSEALHQQGETVLLLDPDSRYTLAGNTLAKISDQIQAIIDRNRPLAVGDKVRWTGSNEGAVGTVVYIDGDDHVIKTLMSNVGLVMAGSDWIERVTDTDSAQA